MSKHLANITAFFTATGLLVGCGGLSLHKKASHSGDAAPAYQPPQLPPFQAALTSYSSCDELQSDIHGILVARAEEEKRQEDLEAARQAQSAAAYNRPGQTKNAAAASSTASAVSPGAAADSAAPSSGAASSTNVQERGVDEADTFKVGDQHLFTVQTGKIQVVARDTLKYLGSIDISSMSQVTLYTNAAQLIVIGTTNNNPSCIVPVFNAPNGAASSMIPCDQNNIYVDSQPATANDQTEVRFYDAAPGQVPALATKRTFAGRVKDSRLANGHLVLVFSDQLPLVHPSAPYVVSTTTTTSVTERPVQLDNDERTWGITCTTLIKQQIRDFDFRLTKVLTLSIAKPNDPEHVAGVLGGGDQIYMSNDHLYIAKQGVEWYGSAAFNNTSNEQLILSRLAIHADTGAIQLEGVGSIQGHVKDQWAFKQLSDSNLLAVMTSTGVLFDQDANRAQNHLWILKADPTSPTLQLHASLHNFGSGEDIRSVRYVGDLAYVVTFKKTDPLFAIDLKDPHSPKLLGELVMPGFSTYLHPVSPTRLVGIGFDATDEGSFAWYQGLQVSLFDITDPVNLKRLDNKIIGNRGSYSDATSDHHAFFFDADSMLMAIPAVQIDGGNGASQMASNVSFSGAIVYKVGDKLTETARLSLATLIPSTCVAQIGQAHWWQDQAVSADVNRIFKVDGKLIAMSRYGLRSYDLSTFEVKATAAYADAAASCK